MTQNKKYYSISIRSHNFVQYHKKYGMIRKHWSECGGKVVNTIFQGEPHTLQEFYLTFNDPNLIITFTELTVEKIKI